MGCAHRPKDALRAAFCGYFSEGVYTCKRCGKDIHWKSDSLRMWVQLVCSGVGIIAAAILFFILAFFLPPLGAAILATLIGFTLGAVMTVHVVRTGNYFITWEEERDKGGPDPLFPR